MGFGALGVNISYNVILGNCAEALWLGGGPASVPPPRADANLTITHNWVEHNGPTPAILSSSAWPCNQPSVLIMGSQHGVFASNYVWNNTYYAAVLLTDRGGNWPASMGWQIENNDIENNQSVGIDILRSAQVLLRGNKISNNGNSPALQVIIDPSYMNQVNADWATANIISYTPPPNNPFIPLIAKQGIVNAASGASGGISPGELLVISGFNLGPKQRASATPNSDGRYERILAGTRVLFDGVPGAMLYTSAGKIGVAAPYYLYWKSTTNVRVEYNGVKSAPVQLQVVPSSPGLFTADGSGTGQVVARNQDSLLNTPATPAAPGSIITLAGTGEGQTDSAGVDGLLTGTKAPTPRLPVSATIGGIPAHVQYAGLTPGSVAGSLMIQVQVPINAPPGSNIPIQITIGNVRSPASTTVSVGEV